ncbi:MAG: hypothetical protein A2882_01365 [Phenylobacterium sp. RIFCSPHIGHO2_01_FULL_70_10]|nr:MAG: hypothetical protein A2882_01365 [Phenylobacterium sp. RIFCSPHIGHO2_01_FULL_70_10]
MSKKASQDALSDLHAALAEALAKRIREGTATAADLAVAKGFLKDNGITADLRPGSPLQSILDAADEAPFDEDEEIARQSAIFAGAPHGTA